MAITIPDWVNGLVENFDGRQGPLLGEEIASALREARTAHEPLTREHCSGLWVEWAAFFFRPQRYETNVWGTYFGPVATWTSEGGTPIYVPDISDADAQAVEYWQKRSTEAQHPILRARYADLVWDLARVITGRRPDVAYARAAIDAYLQVIEKNLYMQAHYGIRYAERALNLAISVNDQDLVERARNVMFTLFQRVAKPNLPGTWLFLFDSLYENTKIPLTDGQRTFVIQSLEEILTHCCTPGQEFDPFSAQMAAVRLARHYRRVGKTEDVHRAIRAYGQAFEKMAAEANPTLAMAWLQPVFDCYRNFGMSEDATRVQLLSKEKGKHAAADMKEISAEITISSDELNEYAETMTADGLNPAFQRIAVQFIPMAHVARNSLRFLREHYPMQAIIGIRRIAESQIIAQAGPVDEDPEGRILLALAEQINFQSPFLSIVLDKTRSRYSVDADQILGYLYESPVFEMERKNLFREGISAYLDGDRVKAIHVLVPQIEHALRTLLSLQGLPTNKPMRSRKGVMQEKTLNDVLEEPTIRECLGEDLWLYLRVFLADPRGPNVRNRVCHGLAEEKELTRPLNDRIIHILLCLGLIRERKE